MAEESSSSLSSKELARMLIEQARRACRGEGDGPVPETEEDQATLRKDEAKDEKAEPAE